MSCIDVIEAEGCFHIIGLLGLASEVGQIKCGYEVIGDDSATDSYLAACANCVITIGQVQSADLRKSLYLRARLSGFLMPTIVSPLAYVSRHAEVGEGTIVMHGAVINANAKVGINCIVNSLALVEHDAVVGDHCHVSTGALINGNARIGDRTFLGSGSIVKHGISVGEGCVVGMGVCVRNDLPKGTIFVGDGGNG